MPEQLQYIYINDKGQYVFGVNTKAGSDKLSGPDLREIIFDPKSGPSTIRVARANTSDPGIGPTNEFVFVFLLLNKNLIGRWVTIQSGAGISNYQVLY